MLQVLVNIVGDNKLVHLSQNNCYASLYSLE